MRFSSLFLALLSSNSSASLLPKPLSSAPATYALNEPYGCLSQFVNNGKKKRKQKLLSDLPSIATLNPKNDLMAIGRLDSHTEGLLLLTTCGSLSHSVTYGVGSSRSRVSKEYYCQVSGIITPSALSELRSGVIIGSGEKSYMTRPCIARVVDCADAVGRVGGRNRRIRDSDNHGPTSWISLVIKEGKNRQVRRMTAAAGFPTLRLVRVRVGGVEFDGIEAGGIREVDAGDVLEEVLVHN